MTLVESRGEGFEFHQVWMAEEKARHLEVASAAHHVAMKIGALPATPEITKKKQEGFVLVAFSGHKDNIRLLRAQG